MTSLDELVRAHEISIRLSFFVAVFAVMALAEILAPRRRLVDAKLTRWANNLGLVAVNVVALRLVFPAAAVGTAVLVNEQGIGILAATGLPYWAKLVLAVGAMDLAIYLQHVMFHALPILWRLHRVHHADLDFDVTTGARFHTIEMIMSMVLKIALVALLGAPVAAVVAFEVLLSATAMFNHSNFRLPLALDRVLRLVVVTPDMHRIHHSVEIDEANSNFGFNLPWWDRLFGTYRAQPRKTHEAMTIGITTFREPARCDRLPGMLSMPFAKKNAGYPIGRSKASG
jgi:sterol desaturase/sphingolipid hydroxylase (fatty acid hydroxylase superfamily)